MSVRGWVLVQTEAGRARAAKEALDACRTESVRVLGADTVTGPHDVIAQVEAPDVDSLTETIEAVLRDVRGVEHIITCVAMD